MGIEVGSDNFSSRYSVHTNVKLLVSLRLTTEYPFLPKEHNPLFSLRPCKNLDGSYGDGYGEELSEEQLAGSQFLTAEVIHVAVGKLGMSGKRKLCIGWSVDRTR